MKRFEVRRTIAASPDAVWARLTDAQALVTGGLGIERLQVLAPRIASSLPDLQPSFEQFGDGLRRLCEETTR